LIRVRKSWLLGMVCLAAALPARATEHLTRSQTEQYRQVGGRFGLTPQQVAQVYSFIDSQLYVIDAAAREKQVNVAAFRAIARELGLRAYGADPGKLIEAIRKQAQDAAKFQADNAALRREIGALQDVRIRAPAEQALARVDAYYRSGDLERAQTALEGLTALRTGELASAGEAWQTAIKAAISLAAARGDLDRVDRLVDEADRASGLRAEQQRHVRWDLRMTQAGAYVASATSRVRFVQGRLRGDNEAILRAISICRENALPLAPREASPADWAESLSFLGVALRMLGEFEEGTTRLKEAVAAYHASSEVQTRERDPLQWAATQNAVGDTLRLIGERESGTVAMKEAVAAHRAALEEYSRPGATRSLTLRGLGYALNSLGSREQNLGQKESGAGRLKEVVDVYRALVAERSRAREPLEWADAQDDLGLALMRLAVAGGGAEPLREAEATFRMALEEQSRRQDWTYALTQTHLGDALSIMGASENGIERLAEAALAYRTALTALGKHENVTHSPDKAIDVVNATVEDQRVSVDWGMTQISLAATLSTIADRRGDRRTLEEAWRLIGEAGAFVQKVNPPLIPWADNIANGIREIAGRHVWKLSGINGPRS